MGRRWPRALRVGDWSLRARLLAGVVGLVLVGLVVSGVTATALLRRYLVHQVDQQLSLAAGALGRIPTRPPPQTVDTGQIPTPFIVTALDNSGQVTGQFGGDLSQNGPKPDLSGVTLEKVRAETRHAFTIAAIGGGSSFRVRAVERPDGRGSVTMAVSLDSVDSTVRRLENVIALVAVLVLIGMIALGTLAVHLGLRPLTRVEETAEQIADGDLSKRVPPAPSGTEIGRLSHALNGMLAQIEQAFSAREHSEATLRQFIADASHELRTPLTTIRGYAELARKGALPDKAAEQQAIGRIESEATRLGRLVEDLLLLAHLDQQRPLHITTVDVCELAADAVADARVRDPDRPIDCDTPAQPVYASVDADRMSQALGNLVTNALVHTPPATPVHVALMSTHRKVTLVVSDEGPGIPPEQREHAFDRFYRADVSRSRSQGGSGLGLAIVRAVTQACGGTVTCTEAPGGGTAFTITVPAAQVPS